MTTRACLPALLLGLLLLPGCGQPALAPVKGLVSCNGKPVASATITFAPVPKDKDDRHPGKAATGFSDAQGNYVLSTFKNFDGALVGVHQVTVSLDDTNPARCVRMKTLLLEVKPGANDLKIELDPK
jgi:hypothetical protein